MAEASGRVADHLTPRQRKWFDSVRSSLERDTGKTLEAWVAVALTCPETTPSKRADWLRAHHGLGVNRAAQVLSAAFPQHGWDDEAALRAALWKDAGPLATLDAVQAAVAGFPDLVAGQRKTFTAWSRNFQFAAAKPLKGGAALLGLAVRPDANPRLEAAKNDGWSERLKAHVRLEAPSYKQLPRQP